MENKITDDLNNLNKDSVKILTDIFKKDEPTYVMKDENYTFYGKCFSNTMGET